METNSKTINFSFVRHGYSCTNAGSHFVKQNLIDTSEYYDYLEKNKDPELTPVGVDASINNGCIISKIIKSLYKLTGKEELKIDKINIVGCSPLIRCMESAYYMTRNWNNPPNKIFVFPLLREIDERSDDKYSNKSRNIMETNPSYAIKSINDQKKYLQKLGILKYFDFTFVEKFPKLRKEPGDINEFIHWFNKFIVPLFVESDKINVFITTHAGVLKDFSEEGFWNNSGFLVRTSLPNSNSKFEFKQYISFNNFLPKFFITDYKKYDKTYFCPNDRCGNVCSSNKNDTSKTQIKKIDIKCYNDFSS